MSKLNTNLTSIALKAAKAASEALLQTGKDVFSVSQQLVPVDKGDLKASGGVEVVNSEHVIVGYGTDHAIYPEFGTSNENYPVQPYLTPALMMAESTFRVRLREAVQKAIR